jgi:anti-sigma regulatory factor (Ser/Thr protein kinase)
LLVASGGHPPALVASSRRGTAVFLEAEGGAIGWPGTGSDGAMDTVLDPGDVLVLYTDGLIEAHKDPILGLRRLQDASGAVAHLPAGPLAEELLACALDGAQRRDDSLVLVLRRVPVAVPSASCSRRVPARAQSVPEVRRELGRWLSGQGIAAETAQLVTSELMTDAVRAARHVAVLRAEITLAGVVLEAYDDGSGGPGLADAGRALPADHAEGGRGLFVVRALSTDVEVRTSSRGTPCAGGDGGGRRSVGAGPPAGTARSRPLLGRTLAPATSV